MTSRPRICWSDLAGASVGVWGLGVEGGANLRKLLAIGGMPVIADDRPAQAEVGGLPVLSTAAGGWEALSRCPSSPACPSVPMVDPGRREDVYAALAAFWRLSASAWARRAER